MADKDTLHRKRERMTEQSRRNSHPYGSVRDAIAEWVSEFPAGKEFHYGDIAADLGLQLPTVSSVILKMVRSENPVLQRWAKAGWYVKPDPHAAPQAPEALPGKPEEIRAGDLLEVVAQYKNGNLLLRAADGSSVWEATQL